MADFTTTRLIQRVRKRAGLPAWGEEGLDAELLERLNDVQRLYLTALLEGAKAEHRQATLDISITSSLRVDIPTRAVAAGIKMLQGVTGSGTVSFSAEVSDRDFGSYRNGDFYVEGNQLVFFRAPPFSTVRVTYSRRMSDLVLSTSVGTITAINTGTGAVTIGSAPSGFPTSSTAYDFVRAKPHFDILAMDKAATRSGTTLTFSATDLPSGLIVGDYVCLAGESPVCQAPVELHPLLAQRAAYEYLDDKGDETAAQAERRLERLEQDAMKLIAERVEEGKLLVNRNGPGWGAGRSARTSGVIP